jgi:hypothetical protein
MIWMIQIHVYGTFLALEENVREAVAKRVIAIACWKEKDKCG